MSDIHLRSHLDYHTLFDPKAYVASYYSMSEGLHDVCRTALEALHQIYNEGKIRGKRMVEVGSGPTIHYLIPAAKCFDELYLSDFSKKNIETQKKWLARDPEALDWQDYFRYFAKKDGKEEAWPDYEKLVRRKIKGIITCDIHQSNPLYPDNIGQFDLVSTSLTLEPGSKDLEQFKNAMKNVVSLVTPGGYFIIYSVLKHPFYTVGTEKFWCLPVTYEVVLQSVKEAGLDVLQTFECTSKDDGDIAPYDGAVMVLGKKKEF